MGTGGTITGVSRVRCFTRLLVNNKIYTDLVWLPAGRSSSAVPYIYIPYTYMSCLRTAACCVYGCLLLCFFKCYESLVVMNIALYPRRVVIDP